MGLSISSLNINIITSLYTIESRLIKSLKEKILLCSRKGIILGLKYLNKQERIRFSRKEEEQAIDMGKDSSCIVTKSR